MRRLILFLGLAAPAWAALGTPVLLDLKDRSTVTRTGNVVWAGVPVTEAAAITDVRNLAITTAPGGACAGGVNIDSHRLVTERWHGDPTNSSFSVKWVLVAIAAPTLAGSGVAHVCLADRVGADPGTAPTVTANASDSCPVSGTCVTVATGINKYWIRTDSFNLFDQVQRQSDSHNYVTHSTSGGIVAVTSAGTFTSATVPTATPGIPGYSIAVEEPNAGAAGTACAGLGYPCVNEDGENLFAQVKVSGALWNGTAPKFTYAGRLFFFGGDGMWLWKGTNIYSEDMFATANMPTSVGLFIPTTFGASLTATFGTQYGTPASTKAVSMANTDDVWLSQYDHGNTVQNVLGNPYKGSATTAVPWNLCDDIGSPNAATAVTIPGTSTPGENDCGGLTLSGFRIVKGTTTQTGGTGNQSDGWMGLDDGTNEANVWMRDHWQNYPVEIEANGDTIAVYQWPKHGDTNVDGRSTGDLTSITNYKRDMALAGQTGFGHFWPWVPGAAMNMTPQSVNGARSYLNLVSATAGTPVVLTGSFVNYRLNDGGTGPGGSCTGAGCNFWTACTLSGGACVFDATKARKVYNSGFTGTWVSLNGFRLAMWNGSTTASGSNLFPQLALFTEAGVAVDASGFGAIPAGCVGSLGACKVGTIDTQSDSQMDSFGKAWEVAGNFTSHASAAPGNDAARWRDTLLFTNPTYFCDTSLVMGHVHARDAVNFLRTENEIDNYFNTLYKRNVLQNLFGIYYGLEFYDGTASGFGGRYFAALGRRHGYDIAYWLQFMRTADPMFFHRAQAVVQMTDTEMQHPNTANPITGTLGTYTCTGTACGIDHTGNATTNIFWDTKHYTDSLNNLTAKHDGSTRCTASWGGSVWFPIYNNSPSTLSSGSADVNPCSDGQQPWLEYASTSLRLDYDIAGNPRSKDMLQSMANNAIFSAAGAGTRRTLAPIDETSGIYNGGAFGRAFGSGIQVGTDAAELLGNGTVSYISLADAVFKSGIQDRGGINQWTQNPTGINYDDSSNPHKHYGSHYFVSPWTDWPLAEYVSYKGNVNVSAPTYAGGHAAQNTQTALTSFANGVLGYFNTTTKSGGAYGYQFQGRVVSDSYAITSDAETLKYIKRALDFGSIGADDNSIATGCKQTGSASLVGDTPSVPPATICFSPTAQAGPPPADLHSTANPNAMTVTTPDIHNGGLLAAGLPYLEYSLVGQSPARPDFPPAFVQVPASGAANGPLTFITNCSSCGSGFTFDLFLRIGVASDFGNLSIVTPISGDFSLTVLNPSGTPVSGITVADSAGDTYTGSPTAVFKTPTVMWPATAGGGAGACLVAPAPPSINYTGTANDKDNRDFLVTVPSGANGEYKIQLTFASCVDPSGAGTQIPEATVLSMSTGNVDLVTCASPCNAIADFVKVDNAATYYVNVAGGVSKLKTDSSFSYALVDPSGNLYRSSTVKTLLPATGQWGIFQNGVWESQSSFVLTFGGVGGVKPLASPSPQTFYDSSNYSNQTFVSNAAGPITLTFSGCANTTVSPLHSGTTNVSYSPTVQETTSGCGAGTPAWTQPTGNLPPGMSLSSAGVISGTPTLNGTYTWTVHVTGLASAPPDATQQMTINDPALCSVNAGQNPLTSGNQNVFYTRTILTSNCANPETWSITVPILPTGLSIDNTGTISGTPTGSGTSTFTAHVVDNVGTAKDLATSINIVPAPLCTITNTSPLANGSQNAVYGPVTLLPSGCGTVAGSGWVVIAGALPTGVALNSTTGALTGTATVASTFNFTVQFNESGGTNPTKAFQITIDPGCTVTDALVLPPGLQGLAYTHQVPSSGCVPPVSWTIPVGALPTGLGINPSTGNITGTPSASGLFTFTIQATDSNLSVGSLPNAQMSVAGGGAAVNVTGNGTLH